MVVLGTRRWRDEIKKVCSEYPPLPEDIFEAMVLIESGGDPFAVSASNAVGLTQIIYKWHSALVSKIAVQLGVPGGEDALKNPFVNLRVGASHLVWCYASDGSTSWERAIRKYFSGSADPAPGFEDGQGTTPDQHITRLRKALIQVHADIVLGDSSVEKPYIILAMGHRSATDGGNPVERELTDDLGWAYRSAFRAAGYRCDIFQAGLDGDNDDDFTLGGGLDKVAKGVAAVIRDAPEKLVVMLDLHYNGANSRFHVIVPDAKGLTTAYAGGAPAADVFSKNTLDVSIAKEITKQVVSRTGLVPYGGSLGIAGLMSERETGVGLDGYRLAMFAASAPYRMKAVRLVVEHGGTNDAKRPNFFKNCADGAVAALNTFYGSGAGPSPDPDPAPAPMFGPFTRETIDVLFGNVAKFDPTGPVSKLWLDRGLKEGTFPILGWIREQDDKKFYVFYDGSIIEASDGKVVWL